MNFARSLPTNTGIGALVDSSLHAQAINIEKTDDILPDFKTQVEQFLIQEKENDRLTQKSRQNTNQLTIFTVCFGLWDLWEYANLERSFAIQAIDNSIAELYHQLDLLATHTPALKVIVPQIVDMTFLPLFQTRYKTEAHFAENQHFMVFLCTYWNAVLLREARNWNHGGLFVLDTHAILMDQIRRNQLLSEGISGALEINAPSPMFENVEQPCLNVRRSGNRSNLHADIVEKCVDPASHLFW
jgi:hypothetical protein